MMIHLLIIDALNLIRRIHAASGSSCLTVCEQSVNQLLGHTHPTHAVAVFDEDDREGVGDTNSFLIIKQVAHQCLMNCDNNCQ